jgi:hypothetical protein
MAYPPSIRDAPDTDLAVYPANPKAEYRYRIKRLIQKSDTGYRYPSGRIFPSKFKCLLRYEITRKQNFVKVSFFIL